jgi:glutaminyl-peptide cyclotransferase
MPLPSLRPLALIASLILAAGLYACGPKPSREGTTAELPSNAVALPLAPPFNADTAYAYVARQVAFGPRVPNSAAHRQCGDWLTAQLQRRGLSVHTQPLRLPAFDRTILQGRNIMGQWRPQAPTRILLAAHWDTRPFADQDKTKPREPIDGANDGGSGVAVLLEIARVLQQIESDSMLNGVGVDLLFFDLEDYGAPEWAESNNENDATQWWCMGSRYWSEHKVPANYSAYYGILLDMVGNRGALFAKEGASMQYAPTVVQKVWATGQRLGYSQFSNTFSEGITDDHVNVNRLAHLNMIDIIEYDMRDGAYFSSTWHTHADNLSNIDPITLKAVGQTLLQVIWEEGHAANNPYPEKTDF